jgi:hypothetical protein
MTGLSREQVGRLHAELDLILDWQATLGRPKALPLYTALVMVLFQLRHNLPVDACAELFGCATATVWRYQEQLEPLIDAILDEFATRASAQAHAGAVLVDGFIAPVGERDATTGLFSDKKHLSGQNVQVVSTLTDTRRACNTALNRIRAAVERAIAHLKNWKILKTGYRRSLHDFPQVLRTVTKLEIYRWST